MEKIIFFAPCFYKPSDSRSTGGTISNYYLFKELSYDYNITIVTAESSSDFDFSLNIVSSKTTSDVYSNSIAARVKRLFRFFWFLTIAMKLSKNDYTYAFFTNGTLISCFKWYKSRNKIILTRAFEDFYVINKGSGTLKEIFSKVMLYETKKHYRAADSIITNSIFMKNKIVSEFKTKVDKVHVLYPPIDIPVNKGFGLDYKEDITIGMVNPSQVKGEKIFIELAKYYKGIDFCYFSRSDKNYLNTNIQYKGWASKTETIFKDIDVLLVPSQWEEPFGRIAAEGILHGKPVIVSNRGGLPEIVNNSFVSDYLNFDSWIENIDRVLNERELTRIAWEKSYSKCEAFSSNNHRIKIAEILHKSAKKSV